MGTSRIWISWWFGYNFHCSCWIWIPSRNRSGWFDIISAALAPNRKKCGSNPGIPFANRLKCGISWLIQRKLVVLLPPVNRLYERLLQLRLAQPQHIINYARYSVKKFSPTLTGLSKFMSAELSCLIILWHLKFGTFILPKFVKKYAASRLERTRDLFWKCPSRMPREVCKCSSI